MATNLFSENGWHKLTRYLFGISKAIKPHLDTMNTDEYNPFRQIKACDGMITSLQNIKRQKNKLVRWLIGIDELINQLTKQLEIQSEIKEQALNIAKINYLQNREELKSLRSMTLVSMTLKNKIDKAVIIRHLEQRKAFIKTAPKRSFMKIPEVFETFGNAETRTIKAQSWLTEKQPANYANLKQVYKRNTIIEESERKRLGECREGSTAWQRASNVIDGAMSAQSYCRRGLGWLQKSAPEVAFDDKGKPVWRVADSKAIGTQEEAMYPCLHRIRLP